MQIMCKNAGLHNSYPEAQYGIAYFYSHLQLRLFDGVEIINLAQ